MQDRGALMETMVGVDCDCSYEVFLQHLAEHGFSLRFQDSMAWLDEQPDQVDFPDQLLQSGLCIPSCVAYLTGRVAEVAGNIARLAGTQSYVAWARLAGIGCTMRGLPGQDPGLYFVHCGEAGAGHCMALRVYVDGMLVVMHDKWRYAMKCRNLLQAWRQASDQGSVYSFKLACAQTGFIGNVNYLFLTAGGDSGDELPLQRMKHKRPRANLSDGEALSEAQARPAKRPYRSRDKWPAYPGGIAAATACGSKTPGSPDVDATDDAPIQDLEAGIGFHTVKAWTCTTATKTWRSNR